MKFKVGDKVKFVKWGPRTDQYPNGCTGEVVSVLEQREHPVFVIVDEEQLDTSHDVFGHSWPSLEDELDLL